MQTNTRRARIRQVRSRPVREGPAWTRGSERDFATVTLPELDCDLVRDLLVAEEAQTVVEVGLAYGSTVLAIGEALVTVDPLRSRHIVIDPFQQRAFSDVGWELLCAAGLDSIATLVAAASSSALPQLVADGVAADAAFVDGSHRFHEVFFGLYFLRKIVRPGGLLILDDDWAPSVRTAVRYYERNLGWTAISGRLHRRNLPDHRPRPRGGSSAPLPSPETARPTVRAAIPGLPPDMEQPENLAALK